MKLKNKIYTRNDQKLVLLTAAHRALIKRAVNTALLFEHIPFPCEVSVIFTDDEAMRRLNAQYRNKDMPTDVLSFPLLDKADIASRLSSQTETGPAPEAEHSPSQISPRPAPEKVTALGDIVISLERAVKQAGEFGHSYEREIAFLTIHSVLHLLGYDHEADSADQTYMEKITHEILTSMGLPKEEGTTVRNSGQGVKKTGFICIIGRPNVGKSTLMNRLLGEKVAIVSRKPQTTRSRITGIYTKDDSQFVFLDTPGMHMPKTKLGEYMMREADGTIANADAAVFIVEPNERPDKGEYEIAAKLNSSKMPCVLAINKVDIAKKDKLLLTIDNYSGLCDFQAIIPISAKTGENVEILMGELTKFLKEDRWYFPPGMITDQPERKIISEIIREKTLRLLDAEIPHGIAVVIEEYSVKKDLATIRAEIYCEKDTHKKIIIGKDGLTLKKIAVYAREDIEQFIGKQVFLDLWVKVKKNWRDSELNLNRLGFDE